MHIQTNLSLYETKLLVDKKKKTKKQTKKKQCEERIQNNS